MNKTRVHTPLSYVRSRLFLIRWNLCSCQYCWSSRKRSIRCV